MEREWLTAEDVSQELGGAVSAYTVKVWARQKKIPHRRIGRFVRFAPEDVAAIKARAYVAPSPTLKQTSRSRRRSHRSA